jgi:hypothetical protein
MEAHLLECPERTIPCPNGCFNKNERIPISRPKLILHHRKFNCAMEVIECKFVGVGCKMKMPRKDISLHENDANAHIGCLLTKINELENCIQIVSGDNESSFHLRLFPNSNRIELHSVYLHTEKDDDWVGLVGVEAVIELVSYSDLHPARKRILKNIYQDSKNWGYKSYM